MITPTVGRVLWFYPHVDAGRDPNGQPLAALLAKVIDDRTVNLTVSNADGSTFGAQHIPLLQDDDTPTDPNAAYAAWMPYQKGQAAKTEQVAATAGAPAPSDLDPIHAKLAQLEPVHAKIDQVEKATQGKFEELGDWLKTTFENFEQKLAALKAPAPATTPPNT